MHFFNLRSLHDESRLQETQSSLLEMQMEQQYWLSVFTCRTERDGSSEMVTYGYGREKLPTRTIPGKTSSAMPYGALA